MHLKRIASNLNLVSGDAPSQYFIFLGGQKSEYLRFFENRYKTFPTRSEIAQLRSPECARSSAGFVNLGNLANASIRRNVVEGWESGNQKPRILRISRLPEELG